MDIELLVKITAKAWALTILSLMHRGVAGRQAPLLAASGAGRTAFVQSLDHLIAIGLLARNPGHGHPLRPEFVLTEKGRQAAALSADILATIGSEDRVLIRRSWTVPVLGALDRTRHFSEIRSRLPRITDRALSLSLKSMENRCWVRREVDDSARPPRSLYTAVNLGETISRTVAEGLVPN